MTSAEDWPEPDETISTVLDVLENVTQAGPTQWQASCPAHEDNAPSLAVAPGDTKSFTVFCHAGCEHPEIVAALVELGVDKSVASGSAEVLNTGRRLRLSKRPKRLRSVPDKPALPSLMVDQQDKFLNWHDEFVARSSMDGTPQSKAWSFLTDERGLTLETIELHKLGFLFSDKERITFPVRVQGKLYNVRRYKPHAKTAKMISWGGQGSPPLLYPWSVLRDTESRLPVLFCEGELDALLANQKSDGLFVAVTGTGGASTPPRDLSILKNRQVFVAYDCDKAGREGAEKLKARLIEAGAAAYVVDLTRLGLSPDSKEDVSDYFLKRGGTAEALAAEFDRLRSGQRERFKTFSAADLAGPLPAMRWLVQGVWPEGSYGTLAGEKKTLKTYLGLSLALAVASGKPFLGRFPVPEPRPVLMYLGEGGHTPSARRLQRLAASMALDLESLPLRMSFDAGDITGKEFLHAFRTAVAEQEPGLVIVDPLYAFHPSGVEAQNLYDRGAMLAEIQQMVPEGCALIIADHFRKTGGKELDLDSIAQAGVGQWADSWVLQKHDTPPRVDEGEFSIGVQFGSRQWGGREFTVDWSLGTFDEETGEHVGDLKYAVHDAEWGASAMRKGRDNAATATLILVLEAAPFTLTRTKVREEFYARHKKSQKSFDAAWDELNSAGRLASDMRRVAEGQRTVNREVGE
ncbi:hypothetical protein GCM10027403_14840 [Arthrobacter tecti]